jgi:beta-phosphoglucomutase
MPRTGVQYDTALPARPLARYLKTAPRPTNPSQVAQMTFSAFLFDYNGVLIDDEIVHWAAFREILRPMGVEMTEADYWQKYLGFDDRGAFCAVLSDHCLAIDDARLQALVDAKKATYLSLAKQRLKGFEGASALLGRLARAGAPIGIVSGALRDEIRLGLELLDASDCVSFVVAAEDTTQSKPDPEGYLLAKAKLRGMAGPEVAANALVIEDSKEGIRAALGAGLPCLAVAHSYEKSQLLEAGAIDVVDRIADISDGFLQRLADKAGA